MIQQSRSFKLGVTGGLACGKSEAAALLKNAGVAVLDTDDVVHRLYQDCSELIAAVAAEFGASCVAVDGSVDRKRLATKVFGSSAALEQLNQLVHPLVRKNWLSWLGKQEKMGCDAAVIIPLLYEISEPFAWDEVWCVAADDDLVRMRLKARHLDEGQMDARLAALLPLEEKCRLANRVIYNNGSLQDLSREVSRALVQLRNRGSVRRKKVCDD